jgi:hypothetical protein
VADPADAGAIVGEHLYAIRRPLPLADHARLPCHSDVHWAPIGAQLAVISMPCVIVLAIFLRSAVKAARHPEEIRPPFSLAYSNNY